MKKVMLFLCLLMIPVTGTTADVTPYDLVYLTEHYPPHNFMEKGVLKGMSVEILEHIWKEMGVDLTRKQIRLLPWARGYNRILNDDNVVLFGMGYSAERMKNLQWIGPYHTHSCVLIARKDFSHDLKSLEDSKDFRIGVVRDDIGEHILREKGFDLSEFDRSNTMDSMMKKLYAKRVDLVCYMDDTFYKNLTQYGFREQDFKIVYHITELKGGYGFSKNIPEKLVKSFQSALDRLTERGVVEKIQNKYIP